MGLLEVHGLVPAIAAADVMAKAAPVTLGGPHLIGDGLVTLVVQGEIAAVQEAVAAGATAAARLGRVVTRHVIGRPADGVGDIFGLPRPRGDAIDHPAS